MYPLNMMNPASAGFAVANSEDEHQALSELGYEPKYEAKEADASEADAEGHTVESVRAALDAAGIPYKRTLGLARLIELLPA